MAFKSKASRNRTLSCTEAEMAMLQQELITLEAPALPADIEGKIIHQDWLACASYLPEAFVDLLILDHPYNLSKNYHGHLFRERDGSEYTRWFAEIMQSLESILKPTATVYVCSDWKTSMIIAPVLDNYFYIQNRITWEREKGRGSKTNWKNNTEDIWFCTVGKDYYFNVDAVKMKKQAIAPYRDRDGEPKDWVEEPKGKYRLTHPSNIWTDISVPFWSMPENTNHPTQKPEKLLAKLILASSQPEDFVFDPFLGSGTSAVVARKLNRCFSGVEINLEYCCWAQKRLHLARENTRIQGYDDGVFWERNSLVKRK
ncbi:DNA-methyltransferase [Roseofilum casamattae]|uniref:Methyltransferase n=1 Tax=Roseofilum casamattae BLCC-M143 TaxID=3022442 RepID=A0ABT7C1L2_9CYAN|nr:site-specific DNA-methyltransferase [Roseofilum casamattae]MDJ1185195.1 site-specific DNA-methyltransferase [Roseofilum casamattae BLCC-M143]